MIKLFRFLAMCTISVAFPTLTIASAQVYTSIDKPQVLSNAVVNEPIQLDVSPPLAELVTEARAQQGVRMTHAPMLPKLQNLTGAQQRQRAGAAAALQPLIAPLISASIGLSFEGVGNTSTLNCPSVAGFTVAPPDTNAAVGDTQVVQWVNVCYAVFDKTNGALIAGPLAGTNFWKGFGAPCETSNTATLSSSGIRVITVGWRPRTCSLRRT